MNSTQAGYRHYDTYSIGVLWNLDARDLNADVEAGTTEPVPVSGDAHLRARADLLARDEAMNKAWAEARMEACATDPAADRRRNEARDRYHAAVANMTLAVAHPPCVQPFTSSRTAV